MVNTFYLKIRANVMLNGDINLAKRELDVIFDLVQPVRKPADVNKFLKIPKNLVQSNTRKSGIIGFVANGCRCDLKELTQRVSFIQEIWLKKPSTPMSSLAPAPWWVERSIDKNVLICMVPLMAASELLGSLGTHEPSINDLREITHALALDPVPGTALEAEKITRRNTSAPHVHGLHKYKAKFFPRMIRSFFLTNFENMPRPARGKPIILDPFSGSGTALIEAALLGFDSVGIDIDKLSCAIAQAKLDTLEFEDLSTLKDIICQVRAKSVPLLQNGVKRPTYRFPTSIAKKFQRWKSLEEQERYEQEIASWLGIISGIRRPDVRRIIAICLSDAISRKFNIRMMGTGVGRFALEIAKANLSKLMDGNLNRLLRAAYTCSTLRNAYSLDIHPSRVLRDTATAMPIPNNCVSLVITSPPYLPASSGRENYLIGKSIAITALGLMTNKQIQDAEVQSVGSMRSILFGEKNGLPSEVYRLYEWLQNDKLRNIKADPTLAYYQDLKQALLETHRVLMPNGIAIYVVGKESVFYRFSTREVLYRVPCDVIFRDIAEECGFIVEHQVDVELDKKNVNARPRSMDSYYESVVQLRKSAKSTNERSEQFIVGKSRRFPLVGVPA
jgi:DNA modification methylase